MMQYLFGERVNNWILGEAQKKIVQQICLMMKINYGTPRKQVIEIVERYEEFLAELTGESDDD